MIYADLIVILIVIIAGYIGMKRGLLRSIVGVFSILISLALASWAYPVVANVINDTGLDETITHALEQRFTKEEAQEDKKEDEKLSWLPEFAKDAVEKQTGSIVSAAKKEAAQAISSLAINILSMLAVFIAVRLMMLIITSMLKIITKLPVIKTVDKGLGALVGASSGILIVYLLLALLTFNVTLNTDHKVGKAIKDSYIASYMYDNNFIVKLISEK